MRRPMSSLLHPAGTRRGALVVNEAMNFGLPVVVSDKVGCAADLVVHGENGYVFAPRQAGRARPVSHVARRRRGAKRVVRSARSGDHRSVELREGSRRASRRRERRRRRRGGGRKPRLTLALGRSLPSPRAATGVERRSKLHDAMSSQRYENHWSVEVPPPLTDPLTARRREFLWHAGGITPRRDSEAPRLRCGRRRSRRRGARSRHRGSRARDLCSGHRARAREPSGHRHPAALGRGASLARRVCVLGRRRLVRGDRALARAPRTPARAPTRRSSRAARSRSPRRTTAS